METKQYMSKVNYVGTIKGKNLFQCLIKQDILRHTEEWRYNSTHS